MTKQRLTSSRKQLQVARQVWPLAKDYYSKARRAKKEGIPVAWTVLMPPIELLHAFEVVPMMTEHFSSLLATKQVVAPYLDRADQVGYPTNACSYHRIMIGYGISGEELMIPEPDFLVAANICDSGSKAFIPVINYFQIPYYFLDTPVDFWGATFEDIEPQTIEYYTDQLDELIQFIEGLTHSPLKEERFQESMLLAKQATDLWLEINELRKKIPCPMGVVDEAGTMYPLMQLLGTRMAVGFYQVLLKEVEARVKAGVGVIEEEKYRLLWLGPIINYDTSILNYFEEFGAVLVKSDIDAFYLSPLDPQHPLESLARKYIGCNFFSALNKRLFLTRQLIQDYQINGVVMYSHLGCRQYCGGQKAVQDMIKTEFGLPILNLSGDLADFRDYNAHEMRNRIDEFIELLE
jgi:benzoyl-CoA reductase/2-hydroxyglutaryl-CoA dehydratase subunit BcrC/BadD/HgdB